MFTPKPGTRSAVHVLKAPLPDITAFTAAVGSLVQQNPLGCTPYRATNKTHPPVKKVRERYTAKFVYEDTTHKQIRSSSEVYDSAEGYQDGIHAVLSSIANISAHQGRARHKPESDHFSVILKCHDPGGELFFVSLAGEPDHRVILYR